MKTLQGVRWKVKLGKEAQPETSATRLLWAVGYLLMKIIIYTSFAGFREGKN